MEIQTPYEPIPLNYQGTTFDDEELRQIMNELFCNDKESDEEEKVYMDHGIETDSETPTKKILYEYRQSLTKDKEIVLPFLTKEEIDNNYDAVLVHKDKNLLNMTQMIMSEAEFDASLVFLADIGVHMQGRSIVPFLFEKIGENIYTFNHGISPSALKDELASPLVIAGGMECIRLRKGPIFVPMPTFPMGFRSGTKPLWFPSYYGDKTPIRDRLANIVFDTFPHMLAKHRGDMEEFITKYMAYNSKPQDGCLLRSNLGKINDKYCNLIRIFHRMLLYSLNTHISMAALGILYREYKKLEHVPASMENKSKRYEMLRRMNDVFQDLKTKISTLCTYVTHIYSETFYITALLHLTTSQDLGFMFGSFIGKRILEKQLVYAMSSSYHNYHYKYNVVIKINGILEHEYFRLVQFYRDGIDLPQTPPSLCFCDVCLNIVQYRGPDSALHKDATFYEKAQFTTISNMVRALLHHNATN